MFNLIKIYRQEKISGFIKQKFYKQKIYIMKTDLGRVVILVNDYDEAFEFYKENFNCKKFFDITQFDGKRYLHISFGGESRAGLWFIKAETEEQKSLVGKQTAGTPLLVMYTDSLEEMTESFSEKGVKFKTEPIITDDYMSVHVYDLYGNEIVFVQLLPGE